jgi:hypothetical protein
MKDFNESIANKKASEELAERLDTFVENVVKNIKCEPEIPIIIQQTTMATKNNKTYYINNFFKFKEPADYGKLILPCSVSLLSVTPLPQVNSELNIKSCLKKTRSDDDEKRWSSGKRKCTFSSDIKYFN